MKDLTVVEFKKQLNVLGACDSAYQWAEGKTLYQAWEQCERADWMMWYLTKIKINRKLLVELACDIAETVLYLIPENEKQPRIVIETTRKWLKRKATMKEVKKASRETYCMIKNGYYNKYDIFSNKITHAVLAAIYVATYTGTTAIHVAYASTYAYIIANTDPNILIDWRSIKDCKTYYKEQHKLLCAMIRQKVDIKTL